MNTKVLRHDTNCRLCGSKKIKNILKLKPTPPEDLFLPKSKLNLSSKTYCLTLALCQNCGYVHLPDILSPDISYSNYVYETKVTVGLSDHYKEYAENIIKYAGLSESSLVVDLGSNDGTMLKAFKFFGMRVLGVEPSEQIANIANDNNLETINDYFSVTVANKIIKEYGKASVITANYMYANIDDVIGFSKNVKKILSDEGLFVIQTGYHPEQMKINMFDYIYHEHFSYFSVKVLKQLLEKCGMEIIHVSLHSAKGGSIRVIVKHKNGKQNVNESVDLFINSEETAGMHSIEPYIRFSNRLDARKKELHSLIKKIRLSTNKLVGYGASHSTTTLLHHFEIGNQIEYIVDDNTIKHDRYSPGFHLPVYSSERLYKDKPEYVLLLAWQHQESIIKRNTKYLNNGGRFIVPLPELKVIG